MSQPRRGHVYPTSFQEVITIDKHKATFRLLISQAMVEKMIVMPRLIKDNSKVHFDMIYPTGFQDVYVVKAIVTDKIFPTGFQDAITMPHVAIMATAECFGTSSLVHPTVYSFDC